MTGKMILAVGAAAVCTFSMRYLPFLLFSGTRTMPEWLQRLGRLLPSAIMAVLVVYCLKDVSDNWIAIGIPKMLAVLTVVITYKWKHNTFFSIIAGTAGYMILLRILQ